MRRLRPVAVAIAAGLVTVSAVGANATEKKINSSPPFRASRIQLSGPGTPLTVSSDSATLTATVKDWKNNNRPKVSVTFSVLSGPDAPATKSDTTDASGTAHFTIANKKEPGTDVVQATFADGLEIHKSERVFLSWQSGPPARSIRSPAQIKVTPDCFQPASAVKVTSNEFRSIRPNATRISAPAPIEKGTITVEGNEFNPFTAVLITFDAGPGGRPQNFIAVTDGFGHFGRDIEVNEPAEGVHLVRADDFKEREADTNYTIPCFMPSLALYPPIGPPGFVALAVGTGFPKNANVTLLNWMAPDLQSPLPKTITTDGNGAFEVPILILYHDILGPRTLQAIVKNPEGDGAGAAIEADAPFLVTLGRAQPRDFVLRR